MPKSFFKHPLYTSLLGTLLILPIQKALEKKMLKATGCHFVVFLFLFFNTLIDLILSFEKLWRKLNAIVLF